MRDDLLATHHIQIETTAISNLRAELGLTDWDRLRAAHPADLG